MQTKKILLIGAGAGLLWWILRKKNTAEKLTFDIVDIRPAISGAAPVVNMNVKVTNPTPEALAVNGVTGTLQLNGAIVGDVYSSLLQQIPANQSVVIPVSIKLYSGALLESIKGFIENITAPAARFVFNGHVNFKGVNFPLSLNYNIL